MLLRFCVPSRDPYSHSPQGVLAAAFELLDAGELESYEEEWLEREMAWLRMHLPVPPCLGYSENDRAICWFKPGAKAAIDKVRGIVALLDSRGLAVKLLKTVDPGTIIYEDGFQMVAKPRRRAKQLPRVLPTHAHAPSSHFKLLNRTICPD